MKKYAPRKNLGLLRGRKTDVLYERKGDGGLEPLEGGRITEAPLKTEEKLGTKTRRRRRLEGAWTPQSKNHKRRSQEKIAHKFWGKGKEGGRRQT